MTSALNEQVKVLEQQVRDHFGRHPDAEIIVSRPGLGPIPGARVPAESGDDPRRCADGRARRNYAGTSPVTRACGKKRIAAARFVRNDRLAGALHARAFPAPDASPGARAFRDQQRAKGHGHNDALRRLASRLAGILRGCLKTRTLCDQDTARGHRQQTRQAARQPEPLGCPRWLEPNTRHQANPLVRTGFRFVCVVRGSGALHRLLTPGSAVFTGQRSERELWTGGGEALSGEVVADDLGAGPAGLRQGLRDDDLGGGVHRGHELVGRPAGHQRAGLAELRQRELA